MDPTSNVPNGPEGFERPPAIEIESMDTSLNNPKEWARKYYECLTVHPSSLESFFYQPTAQVTSLSNDVYTFPASHTHGHDRWGCGPEERMAFYVADVSHAGVFVLVKASVVFLGGAKVRRLEFAQNFVTQDGLICNDSLCVVSVKNYPQPTPAPGTTSIRRMTPLQRMKRLQNLMEEARALETVCNECGGIPLMGFDNEGHLTGLQMSRTSTRIPDDISTFRRLKRLDLLRANITHLPQCILDLTNLKYLNLQGTNVASLPDLSQLTKLKKLDLSETSITEVPNNVWGLEDLETLHLSGTNVASLPDMSQLTKLTLLNLSRTSITEVPINVWGLEELKTLYLKFTEITTLPEGMSRLKNLMRLDISATRIMELPKVISQLPSLQYLGIRGTQIEVLPEWITSVSNLQALDIEDTNIALLPSSMGKLQKLELLLFHDTKIPQLNDPDQRLNFFLDLIHTCPSLRSLGRVVMCCPDAEWQKLGIVLASRTARAPNQSSWKNISPSLWPLAFEKALRAFPPQYGTGAASAYKRPYAIEQQDAIFWLLRNGRDFFVEALLEGNSRDQNRNPKRMRLR